MSTASHSQPKLLRETPCNVPEAASQRRLHDQAVRKCVEETRYLLTDPFKNRATDPKLFGMGLMDWTIEELLIRKEDDAQG